MPKELHVTIVTNTERRRSALLIPGYMQVQDKAVEIKGLIDTGADAVIVNKKIVDKYNLPTVRLPKTLTFRNADDSVNSMGTITHRVEGTFNLHGKKLPTNWYVADIGRDDVLFGMPWIRKYNPNIDWESGRITFKSDIIKKQQQIHKYQCEHDPPEGMLWNFPVKPLNQDMVVSFVRAIPDEDDADPDSERLMFNPSRAIELWYRKKKIRKINKSTEIAIAAKKDQKEKTLDEILPDFVKDYRQVFEKKAASRFPLETMGPCYRIQEGLRPSYQGVLEENLPTDLYGTHRTRQIHCGEPREGLHSKIQVSTSLAIFLCHQEGWESSTCSRLQGS